MRRLSILALVFGIAACSGDSDSTNNSTTSQDGGMTSDSGDNDAGNNTDPGEVVGSDELVFDDGTFSVDVTERSDGTRVYEASSTYQQMLEGSPTSRTITESPDRLRLRSGRLAFDALFALAVQEADENAVEQISDGAFNNGEGVPCSCYETGEKWNYVWTRDTAYAVDLGLEWIDPERARRSLEFKLSEPKAGGPVEIVQDTGTGGSWPVSTDRVSWVKGAAGLSAHLEDPQAFRARMDEAIDNTVTTDRAVVFDSETGLYRGEQSFLDWREQSYPRWTATDTRHIAQSHALSTNLMHLLALQLAEREGDAEALKDAIVETFWDEDAGMYRAMTATELDGGVPAKYDLLGNSLAVLAGLPHAERAVSSYPYGPKGASVIWPQQPRIPIYHNRGQWPFVSAYAALAAARVNNPEVFDRNAEALIRGAALNLSNMENFEWLSGAPRFEEGEFTGPVVNSRRQLWSVAGYIGLVVKGMFALVRAPADAEQAKLGVGVPFVPTELRDRYFPDSTELRLENILIDGVAHSVTLELPPAGSESDILAYQRAFEDLPPDPNTIDFVFRLTETEKPEGASIAEAGDPSDFRNIFAPVEPDGLALSQVGGGVELAWNEPEPGVTYDVYRFGERVAADLESTAWTDSIDLIGQSVCYSVVAKFPTGLESHPSQPTCWFGDNGSRVQTLDVYDMAPSPTGGVWSTEHGRPHIGSWGDPTNAIYGAPFRPRWSGRHAVQIIYGNGANGFTTGITAAVKRLVIRDLTNQTTVQHWIVMPQRADWANWGPSAVVYFDLDADNIYDWQLIDGVNMSYFDHFTSYTGGAGGGEDPYNAANIHAVELLPISGQRRATSLSPVPLNGTDDFGKYATERTLTPGATLQDWSRFALAWDDDYLYATQVSEAFEGDFTPWMLYFGDGDANTGSTSGLEYSGQTANLPFAADWAVSLRAVSYDGTSPDGPWNGVFRWDGQGWVRERRFAPGRDWWLAADRHTLSARIPRGTFRGVTTVQMAGHIVYAQPANEWKETVPAGHTPWVDASTGYYEVDLSQQSGVSSWGLR